MDTTTTAPNHPPDMTIDCRPDNDYLHARLNNPSDHSLIDLLDAFYHHFGISNYLDQIGIIDDRLTTIVDQLNLILADYDDQDLWDRLNPIIDSIDNRPAE